MVPPFPAHNITILTPAWGVLVQSLPAVRFDAGKNPRIASGCKDSPRLPAPAMSWMNHRERSRDGREVGVSTYTIYLRKAKYGGWKPSDAVRLLHLENENNRNENNRLKQLVNHNYV
jgi:hypothetical protein